MVETLILPGLNGSGEAHWQRIWANERADCRVLEQQNWSCPDMKEWRVRLEDDLERSEGVVLLAHSLGCILAASLARSPYAPKVHGAVLVAPCDMRKVEELHPCAVHLDTFPNDPLPFPSLIIGSTNDVYMDPASLRHHARSWGSDIEWIGSAGHINIASGFGRWTKGYSIFDQFVEQHSFSAAASRDRVRKRGSIDLLNAVADSKLSLTSY